MSKGSHFTVKAPFLSEPVRVLSLEPLDSSRSIYQLQAVGTQTGKFYQQLLTADQLSQLSPVEVYTTRNFSGRAEGFFLAMEAHRIRYAYLFDPLHAVNVSQIDPLPHQIDAVYYHIIRQPRIRFLLADDPGAGKTIMAGLVLKELKHRGLVRRALIIAPGHLQEQWQREMKERFGEAFTIVNRSTLNAWWGRNIWQELPQVITSMDFAKQEEVLASLKDAEWDIVIVDEAHKMAAYQYGTKIRRTDRYRLGEGLSPRTKFLLFLTATPHRGDPENFRLLLELLEPGFFGTAEMVERAVANDDSPIFLRRLKEDLRDFEGRPLFPPRHVHTVKYHLSDDEVNLYNEVTRYVSLHMNKALQDARRNVAFAMLVLQRRLASSVYALRDSLERRRRRLSDLLKLGRWLQEQKGEINWEELDELDDAQEAERLKQEQELVEKLTTAQTQQELEEEIAKLEELIFLAKEVERKGVETKLNELRRVVENERLRETGEKLLVFTESVRTMEYLANRLQEWGFSVTTLHGGMNLDARIRAEHEFRDKAQIMVSTEAGGEGINLQFCSLMVNYDIPWSFTRLEQRMGRIHRYGQRKEVHIYNLVADNTIEGKVLYRLFERLEAARAQIRSDKVYDVIGEVVTDRRLEELLIEALSHRRTLDEILAEIDAVPDEEVLQRTRQALFEALATRYIDLQRILGDERTARENRLVPEYIEAFFERACRFFNIPAEKRKDNPKLWRVEFVPFELRNQPSDFKNRFGVVYDGYHKLAFEKEAARREEAEFIAPGHPLLEALIERLFRECSSDLESGATFGSTTGQKGWLWFLEGTVVDGNGETAGQRVVALFQDERGNFRITDPAILWDLVPLERQPEGETSMAIGETEERAAIAKAFTDVLEPYRRKLQEEREKQAEVKRKYGVRSLELLIAESDAKIADYEAREFKGEDVRRFLQPERRKNEELRARLEELKRQIERETKLSVPTPKLLGVARVVPYLGRGEVPEVEDPEVEAIGMKVVLEYERRQGRSPEDVSLVKCGYDIRSYAPDGSVRYIEVKARTHTGPIVLTTNEWRMAHRLGDDYWLYVVNEAKTTPKLFTIQNPAEVLHPEEKIVQYIVRDWHSSASQAEV